jgi:hypothetical protein
MPGAPAGEAQRRERGGFSSAEGLIGLEREPVRPLSPDERREVVLIVRERDPVMGAEFDKLQVRGVELFERTIDGLAPRVRMFRDAKEKGDKEMAELRFDDLRHTVGIFNAAFELTSAIKSDNTDRVAKAQEDMRTVLGHQFDTRVAIREREIEQFMKRIESMRKEIESLKGKKRDIIDNWDFFKNAQNLNPGGRNKPERERGRDGDRVEPPPPPRKPPDN